MSIKRNDGRSSSKLSEVDKFLQNSPQAQSSPEKLRYIIWNEYELGDLIGAGSFGHVHKCRHVKSGKEYAVKKFKNKYQTKKKAFEQREIQILSRFEEMDKKGR